MVDHVVPATGLWVISQDEAKLCPLCGAFAVVELPAHLKAVQPDTTTHVCHPGFGGCNHGFGPAPDEASGPPAAAPRDMPYEAHTKACSAQAEASAMEGEGPACICMDVRERTDWTNTGSPFCPRCGYPDAMDAPENQSPLAKSSKSRR